MSRTVLSVKSRELGWEAAHLSAPIVLYLVPISFSLEMFPLNMLVKLASLTYLLEHYSKILIGN